MQNWNWVPVRTNWDTQKKSVAERVKEKVDLIKAKYWNNIEALIDGAWLNILENEFLQKQVNYYKNLVTKKDKEIESLKHFSDNQDKYIKHWKELYEKERNKNLLPRQSKN